MDLSLVDLLGSVRRSSLFVCLQVGSFLSTLFIGGACCSGALVLWGLSMTTFRLSTRTRFTGSDEGGAMTAARLRPASVLVVVARWSTDLDVIFIISSVRCTTMIKNE